MAENQDSHEAVEPTAAPNEPKPPKPDHDAMVASIVKQLEQEEAAGEGELGDTDEPEQSEQGETGETPSTGNGEVPGHETPEEVRHAQRMAEVARRDRILRQQRAELQQYKQQLEAREQALGSKEQWKEEVKKAFNDDPLRAMRELGIDLFDSLSSTDKADDASTERIAMLQARIDAMEQREKEQQAQKQSKRAQQQYQAAYQGALSRIYGVVSSDHDNHEAVLDHGQEGLEDVFKALDVMYSDAVAQGYTPGAPTDEDIKRAAGVVEEVYRKRELEELQQKARSKRYAGRLTIGDGPTTTIKTPVAKDPTPPTPQQSTKTETLTNDLQGQAPQQRRLLSEEERMAAALAIPFEPPDES
jgi:hypothetical protein